MAKAATKLYREPQEAEKALKELKDKGYRAEEISILAKEEAERFTAGLPTKKVALPQAGSVTAAGAVAAALGKGDADPEETLVRLWGLSEEALSYYEFGLSLGGIVVGVEADEERAAEVRQILRSAEAVSEGGSPTSPGFAAAGRMTQTDPLDAKMSGDFRRY